VSEKNGTYLSDFIVNVGWVRRVLCAVTHRMYNQKNALVLLRNGWRVTRKTLTRPTF